VGAPRALRRDILAALGQPRYRQAARHIPADMAAAPGFARVGRRRRSVDRRISQTSAGHDLAVSDRRAAIPAICLKMIVRNEAHIIHENVSRTSRLPGD
jgi:hypothetical protein